MVAILPEFYTRKVTLDDLKYAQQATDVFNAAYGGNNGMKLCLIHLKMLKLSYRWLGICKENCEQLLHNKRRHRKLYTRECCWKPHSIIHV